jgi:hypothetical protein
VQSYQLADVWERHTHQHLDCTKNFIFSFGTCLVGLFGTVIPLHRHPFTINFVWFALSVKRHCHVNEFHRISNLLPANTHQKQIAFPERAGPDPDTQISLPACIILSPSWAAGGHWFPSLFFPSCWLRNTEAYGWCTVFFLIYSSLHCWYTWVYLSI